MCGIAGIYAPRRQLSSDAVVPMLVAMAHRGPDDSGINVLADGQLVFGHLRLSILDLSPLGHQPMALADRRIWIVYNGEVYNFREIRTELASLGWSFVSESDTEVILAAYQQWGLRAVDRFRGMFAFAIWDGARRLLHLCRDRFGVKPLYYSVKNGVVAFASESKALNVAGHTNRDPDPVSVAEFVQYGYISAPRSVFSDILSVRPGTICTFDASAAAREHTYWSAASLFDGDAAAGLRSELSQLPEQEILERTANSLQRAFEYRMVADVPVGLFLSGGIDSSLVAALLARRSGIKLNTFTIGYGDSEFDERSYARTVAQALDSTHIEFNVSPNAAVDLADELPSIADEPIGDSSILPTLMVSRLARQHVKVALSADGADELFGGYVRYAYCGDFVQRHSRLLRGLYCLSAEVLERLPPRLIAAAYTLARRGGPKFAAINDKLRKFVRMSRAADGFEAYEAAVSEWSAHETASLVARQAGGSNGARATFESVVGADPHDQFMHYDLTRYLPGDLLVKVDRASMYVSLEAREPFLDHEAARVAAALPLHWKIRNGQNKYVLRRLLCQYFPAALFDRPKQGFSAPIGAWLRGPLRTVFLQELSPTRVREFGILDPGAVTHAVHDFMSHGRHAGSPAGAWILLQLQQWASRWLRAPTAGHASGAFNLKRTLSSNDLAKRDIDSRC
jgi:asparagine synthase (glutamine-hydrolysing)